MSDFKVNMESIADELLKAKSFFKEKVFENIGVTDMIDKIVASNLTVALFSHLKDGDSKEKRLNDVHEVYSKFLESLSKDSDAQKGSGKNGNNDVISS
ncbi:MAG: hypothetical protein ACUZ8O_11640 [Candidatus Anammoxibacter sp.]